jgi:ligand-binding SRPBCC domain-containing protein
MKYRHTFRVRAPLEAVRHFHARGEALAQITPPPLRFEAQQVPDLISSPTTMCFTLWLGPLPIRWVARIEDISPDGFVDRQESGPFHTWIHRHAFRPLDEGQTEVLDQIEARLRPHLFWGPFGLGMLLGLPLLFAYRARKTRQLMENFG